MKISFKLFVVALAAIISVSCVGNGANSASTSNGGGVSGEAKYIFYFIGDGMAAPQVRLAEAALTSPEFQKNYAKQTNSSTLIEQLNIESLSITGLATSNAQNRYITDSAAAGTALATGSKTNVGMISESAEGQPLKTIAEMARDKGMKVGIVSSVSIDHATPACFYAHIPSRNNYHVISDQLLTSGFDYFGGGMVKLDKRASAEGTDKATAYATYKKRAEESGFKLVTTKSEFDRVGKGESKSVIATLDMLANEQYTGDGSALPYTIDLSKQSSEDNKISLAQFTQKGIELMEGEDGFFMMVEGGKIDWTCHANDAAACAYEVVAFDEAIGVALDFAAKHPTQTLIVVTGDHDCGGLAIGFAGTGYESAFNILANPRTSYAEFTGGAVQRITAGEPFEKLLAYACEQFGFTDNIKDGSDGIIQSTMELSNIEVSMLKDAYQKSQNKINGVKFTHDDLYFAAYGGYDPFTTTCTHIINNKSGVEFASFSHTAVPVMVFAQGVNAELFSGYYDNTDIAKRIMMAADLK
ncbi:MAG: alkaline phosphatase [Rikenellaceae bacterium]